MPTPIEENYLKALFNLAGPEGKISLSDLSKRLGVSAPTANSMIRKLHQRGLVAYAKYQPIQLTEAGQKEAGLIIRKHRLTEMYLVEKMGFGWEEVHDIAEQIEHLQAPKFFERMDELLGHPEIDPHGSPIPGKDGVIAHHHAYRRLSDCAIGERVKLSAVIETSDDFLRYLNGRNIALGTEFVLQDREPFDGSIIVQYDGRDRESLPKMVVERLLVVEL